MCIRVCYWTASSASTDYPVLDRHLQIDVAIVGGGLAGIPAAYLLKQEKLRVAVLEAGRIGQGATGIPPPRSPPSTT